MDKETFLAKLAESTRQFVDAAIAPISEQLKTVRAQVNGWEAVLEARLARFVSEIEIDYRKVSEIIEPMIPQPVHGKDAVVDYDAIKKEIAQLVDALPKPKDGASVNLDEVNSMVQVCVEEAVALIPKPKNGESVDLTSLHAFVKGCCEAAVEELPKAKDGKDAVVDWPTIMSKMSELINALPKPRDGRDALNEDQMKAAIVHYAGDVFATFSQEMIALNERDFVIRTTISGRTIEQQLHMPTPLYKGVWRDGEYMQGDQVRRGGAVWHCNADRTTARPDSGNGDWTLAVNKGADGRDFRPEEPKANPVVRLK